MYSLAKVILSRSCISAVYLTGSSKPSSSSDSDGSYEDAAPDEMDIRAFIVHGPPGVGKTTAIHALARELSFTVIEINPASCSDARQILLQSLEATQSHRITSSGQKNGICSFFSKSCDVAGMYVCQMNSGQ